jgi:hypothetical protein
MGTAFSSQADVGRIENKSQKPIINDILISISESIKPPELSAPRGAPEWNKYLMVQSLNVQIPNYEFDQRIIGNNIGSECRI